MTKKIVHYKGIPDQTFVYRYIVVTTDHPNFNPPKEGIEVITSRIVKSMDEDGMFETENSIYMREENV